MIKVLASKHPLKADFVEAEVESGQTVREIVGNVPVLAFIDGHEVPTELINFTKPKEGSTLTVWPLPAISIGDVFDDVGDFFSDPLGEVKDLFQNDVVRTLASIAISFYAPQLAGAVLSGTALAGNKLATFALAAGIGAAGNVALNSLVPPVTPDLPNRPDSFNRLAAITGTSNKVAAFSEIPRLYGDFRYFPPVPMTARPYTEIAGDDQYLRMLLCLGHGPLEINGQVVGQGRDALYQKIEGKYFSYKYDQEQFLNVPGDKYYGKYKRFFYFTSPLSGEVNYKVTIGGGARRTGPGHAIFSINGTVVESGFGKFKLKDRTTVQGTANLLQTGQNYVEVIIDPNVIARGKLISIELDAKVEGNVSDEVKIGETSIAQYEDIEYEIGTPDQITLYSDQVIETVPGFVTESDFSDVGRGSRARRRDDGQFAIRTTEPDTEEVSLDLVGSLFSVNSKGNTTYADTIWSIEYRETGSEDDWTIVTENWRVSSRKKETVRENYRFEVPKGQYDIRLTRLSTRHNDFEGTPSNRMNWSALRSIKKRKAFDVDNMVAMALRIRANDQLNGRLDNLSVRAKSVLPVWNGSEWVEQTTSNPAWVYSDIWTGTANRDPIDKSDLDTSALLEWANYCDQEGLEYNGVFDSSGTTFSRASEVASTGLASWGFDSESKITVIRDVDQDTPKMVISPRNSSGFGYEVIALDFPDALRVGFVDKSNWENSERVVYDDGFDETNAVKFESINAPGVTSPEQAWKFGRYHLAQQRLRPERFFFKQDVQHLRYKRGDLLSIQHDVMAVGITSARIKEVVSSTEIVVDEVVVDEGKSYALKIQHFDGTISFVGCTPESGSLNKTLVLDNPVDDLEVDSLVVFGESGKESIDVKVSSIEPEGDFVAKITCVPAAPEINQALTGNIPEYQPIFTRQIEPDLVSPKQPVIEDIKSDVSALYVDADGSLRVRMLVSTALDSFPGWDQRTQLRFRPVDNASWVVLDPVYKNTISVEDVDEGVEYQVQVRGVKDGLFSDWSDIVSHTVVGKTEPPSNVDVLNAVQNGENVVFRWRGVTDPDIEGYEIRYGPRATATWESSTRIVEANKSTTIAQADVPPGDYKFFIKALDTSGNFSREAAERLLVVKTEFQLLNEVEHSPDWDAGWFTGFKKVGSVLEVNNDFEGFFISDEYDTGFDADDLRLYAQIDAGLSDVEDVVDNGLISAGVQTQKDYQLLADAVELSIDNGELIVGLPVSDPLVFYEISTRNEGELYSDPNADLINYGAISDDILESEEFGLIDETPGIEEDQIDPDDPILPIQEFDTYDTLMGWTEWTRGEVDARYVLHRARIRKRSPEEGGKLLRRFKTTTDVPERIERQTEKTVAPGGTTFSFNRQFHFTPTVVGIVESDNALFPIRKNVSDTEVTFVVRDGEGNDVGADNFDFIATGA